MWSRCNSSSTCDSDFNIEVHSLWKTVRYLPNKKAQFISDGIFFLGGLSASIFIPLLKIFCIRIMSGSNRNSCNILNRYVSSWLTLHRFIAKCADVCLAYDCYLYVWGKMCGVCWNVEKRRLNSKTFLSPRSFKVLATRPAKTVYW